MTGGYGAAIGGYLQGIGGTVDAFGGGGSYSVLRNTKNQGIQNSLDSLIGDYRNVIGLNSQALNDYITRYLGGQNAAGQRTGQEIGAMDQFYNGSMQNQLAQLRAERAKAMTDAATVAGQQALRSFNQSNVGLQGGGSSYGRRMLMGSLQPIQVQAALDANNQSRADLGYLTQNQIALSGQRQNLANALAQYQLQIPQVRMGLLGQQAGYLGNLQNMDLANNFYGLQYDPNLASKIAASLEATGAGLAGGSGAAEAGQRGVSRMVSMGNGGGGGGGYPMTLGTGTYGGGGTNLGFYNPAQYASMGYGAMPVYSGSPMGPSAWSGYGGPSNLPPEGTYYNPTTNQNMSPWAANYNIQNNPWLTAPTQ